MRVISCALLFSFLGVAAHAGSGPVAIQSADPSCPDDSDNVYVDCGNGTVTDNRTGLVWLKNANCYGAVNWYEAVELTANLSDISASSFHNSEDCGLSDGSVPGEWRLPTISEWETMIEDAVALGCREFQLGGPSITNDTGTSCWQAGPGNSFVEVQSSGYWSANSFADGISNAFGVDLDGGVTGGSTKTLDRFMWAVRGGQ